MNIKIFKKDLPSLGDLANLCWASIKIFFLSCCFVISLTAQSQKITGNAFWDLQAAADDTASVEHEALVKESSNAKSPLLNSLYSLAIPGAGQYSTERYTKAAIFITVEAALITFAIINNQTGNKKTDEFQKYADAHWSPRRYALWINTYGVSDYGPAANIDLNKVDNRDFGEINEWESAPATTKTGFSHQLPPYGTQQYYELIGKYDQYKFGWDQYPQDAQGVPVSDGRDYYGMVPQQMKNYAVDRGKANDYFYAASFAVSALVVNHVISAIDAFISTRSYNKEISASLGIKPVETYEGTRLLSEMRISVGL